MSDLSTGAPTNPAKAVARGVDLVGEQISHRFRRTGFTIDIPHIEARAGKTLALLGPSGSGKSTVLNVLGLLMKPDRGRVLFDGREVKRGDRQARLEMAAVFQRSYLFKGSVAQNVAYGLVVRGVARAEQQMLVAEALEQVGLAGYETRGVSELSGGEAQRVSLARALVVKPRVLLLDEPLANLDPLLKRRLTREFASIVRDAGATVIWVTHDQDEAIVAADDIAIIRDGSLAGFGPADTLMALPPDPWTAEFLGLVEPTAGQVVSQRDGLLEVASGSTRVFMIGSAPTGTTVRYSVRPEDITLFEADADIPASTARNQISATVESVDPRGASTYVIIVADGVRFAASVSRVSVTDLGLEAGKRVYATFKATAVRWA